MKFGEISAIDDNRIFVDSAPFFRSLLIFLPPTRFLSAEGQTVCVLTHLHRAEEVIAVFCQYYLN
jgi:hypothetical protein